MSGPLIIAPSILAADVTRLGEEVRAVDAAGADWIHVDIMDGHFVPNISFGPSVVHAIRPLTRKPIDVHLMIAPVAPHLAAFAGAGADSITIHIEAEPDIRRSLAIVRGLGKRVGVTLKPATPASALAPVIDLVDLVLVMSVEPGFGGQPFMPAALERIAAIRVMLGSRDVPIEVDGGVTTANVRSAAEAGASVIVAGSAVFKGGATAYAGNIAALRTAAR